MIRYKENPFYLTDEQVQWVENTYDSMSLEEKIGQLFCPIVFTKEEKELKELVETNISEERFIVKDRVKN